MKQTVVRYRTKPECAEENTRLIEEVFQELQARAPGRGSLSGLAA